MASGFGRVPSPAVGESPHLAGWVACRKLDMLDAAVVLHDLACPPGNQLEALRGDHAGQHSTRVNDQRWVCFRWTETGPERVEIVDYHG